MCFILKKKRVKEDNRLKNKIAHLNRKKKDKQPKRGVVMRRKKKAFSLFFFPLSLG